MQDERITRLLNARRQFESLDKYVMYKHVDEMVNNYVREIGGVLFGGRAIAALAPPGTQIYEPHDIPDYDVFVPGVEAAQAAAQELKRRLLDMGTLRSANVGLSISATAWKVYADYWGIVDFKGIDPKVLQRLKEDGSQNADGIAVVSRFYLLRDLHREFATPLSEVERLPKLWPRYLALVDSVAPGGFERYYAPLKPDAERLVQQASAFAEKRNLALIGVQAALEMLAAVSKAPADARRLQGTSLPLAEYMSGTARSDAASFLKTLRASMSPDQAAHLGVRVQHIMDVERYSVILRSTGTKRQKSLNIVTFSQPPEGVCLSKVWHKGRYIGSFDTVQFFLYLLLVSPRRHRYDAVVVALASYLDYLVTHDPVAKTSPVLSRFTTLECTGQHRSLLQGRYERMLRGRKPAT